MQQLIENGADANAQGGRYGNALQAASARDHKEVVQLPLENGANINAQGGRYGNALRTAWAKGHKETAQLLLMYELNNRSKSPSKLRQCHRRACVRNTQSTPFTLSLRHRAP
jgi:hypothetical protein